MTEETTLLTFPCDFTIKVFGTQSEQFKTAVITIIRKHIPDFSDDAIKTRPSANGKYSAMSITVHVISKTQLDAIYTDLSSSPDVLMSL